MTSDRLPMVENLTDFDLSASPVNGSLIRDFVVGDFLKGECNIVPVGGLVGGAGVGKTRRAVAIARSCICKGARGGGCNVVVDLVNHPKAEGRTADQITRRDFHHPVFECRLNPGCHGGAALRLVYR